MIRLRSIGVMLALAAILFALMALLAWYPTFFPAHGHSAQVFIYGDDQHSGATILALDVTEELPVLQSYKDQRMTCDGVTFSYGSSLNHYNPAYFGSVPTRSVGQRYHCVFHDWQGEAELDIPVVQSPSLPHFLAPAQQARLSRNEAVTITLAFPADAPQGGAPAMMIEARDAQVHSTTCDSYGAGGYRGHATFKPVANRSLVAGPGTLVAQYQIDQYPAVAGWQSVQLLYRPATVLPVTWI